MEQEVTLSFLSMSKFTCQNHKFNMKNIIVILFTLTSLCLYSCLGSHESKNDQDAADCYNFEFGMKPPNSVSEIKVKQLVIADSATAWMKFKIGKEDIKSLLDRGFFAISIRDFSSQSGIDSNSSPEWWIISSNSNVYKIETWKKDYSRSIAFISYDESSGIALFCHKASD